MGLGDLDPVSSSDNSSSSSGWSSSSGSSESDSNRPYDERKKIPYWAIWEDDDGQIHAANSPQNEDVYILEQKQNKGDKWQVVGQSKKLLRHWMSLQDFQYACHIVEEVFGYDFIELLREDPRAANEAIVKAAKEYRATKSNQTTSNVRDCGVCGEPLHVVLDEVENVGDRVVCPEHTVTELRDADLL